MICPCDDALFDWSKTIRIKHSQLRVRKYNVWNLNVHKQSLTSPELLWIAAQKRWDYSYFLLVPFFIWSDDERPPGTSSTRSETKGGKRNGESNKLGYYRPPIMCKYNRTYFSAYGRATVSRVMSFVCSPDRRCASPKNSGHSLAACYFIKQLLLLPFQKIM